MQSINGAAPTGAAQPHMASGTRPVSSPTGQAVEASRRARPIPTAQEIDNLSKLANILSKSGFFKDAAGSYQAFAKLLFGRDLGLSATAALTGVNLVEGKPELSANVQAQMVRSYIGVGGERYDYKVISPEGERHNRCEIAFYRIADSRRETLGTSVFTMEDAERAGLTRPTRRGEPSNYLKYPTNMLFARAMSNGVAFHCPEVTGGVRVYHDGELDTVSPASPAGRGSAQTTVVPEGPEAEVIEAEVIEKDAAELGASEPPEDASKPPEDAAGTNPHGARVREHAKLAGVSGAQLANLMLKAAGGEELPDERAEALLEEMLARTPQPIAEKTIRLLKLIEAQQQHANPNGAAGEDFSSYEPPLAA